MPSASAKADKAVSDKIQVGDLVPRLLYRSAVLSSIRKFLDGKGFHEVETPLALVAPAPEEYIDCPACTNGLLLRSSPELEMKRLLCAGMGPIYEIGPCFRADEHGRIHRPEFTMLEWYMPGAGYLDEFYRLTRDMVLKAAEDANGSDEITFRGRKIFLGKEWEIISVRDAFRTFASKSADEAAEEEGLFELILTDEVEPKLPKDVPCVLTDYPVRFGAFAQKRPDDPTLSMRWELYVGGVELCNTYQELTDGNEQAARFREFAETRKANGLKEYPFPQKFIDEMLSAGGLPAGSGSAMGFDRLVMLLAGADSIDEVSFPAEEK